jgi:hypothetical protein
MIFWGIYPVLCPMVPGGQKGHRYWMDKCNHKLHMLVILYITNTNARAGSSAFLILFTAPFWMHLTAEVLILSALLLLYCKAYQKGEAIDES